MFKRKAKKGLAPKHAEIRPFQLPEQPPSAALSLPDTSAFRTSLIMPYLSSRFELLREADGSLVSLDKFESALRNQRATGFISEQEEQALLHQFHLQALKEGVKLPRSMYAANQQRYSDIEEELQDATLSGDEQTQPMSLHEFHKMRGASGGSSSMFGHNGTEAERSRTVSGRTAASASSRPSSDAFLQTRGDGNEASTSFEDSEDQSMSEDFSFSHQLRVPSPSPPPETTTTTQAPPVESEEKEDHAEGLWKFNRKDLNRLSRVLDEMAGDFGAHNGKTFELSPANGPFTKPNDLSPNPHHPDPSLGPVLEQSEEEEHIDPILSSKSRPNSASTSGVSSQTPRQLSIAISTPAETSSESQSALSVSTAPSPLPLEPPAPQDQSSSSLGTPTEASPDHPLLAASSSSQFLTPTTHQPQMDAPGPSPFSTFQAMFPSPVGANQGVVAPSSVPLDSPINRFPTDRPFESSPVDVSMSSSNDVEPWSNEDLALYEHSPMPPTVETMPGQPMTESLEASPLPRDWAMNHSTTASSEETALSAPPSESFNSPRRLSSSSLSSIGSSYHGEAADAAAADDLCEDVVLDDNYNDPRDSVNSAASYSLPPFDQVLERHMRKPSTSQWTLEHQEHSDAFWTQPSLKEQQNLLQGLLISDLAQFQKKLVLSASQRSGGRLLEDPSPSVGQRAVFQSVGTLLDLQQLRSDDEREEEEQQDRLHPKQEDKLVVNPPDSAGGCSADSDVAKTPSLLGSVESPTTDASAPSTPPANAATSHAEVRRPSSALSREVSFKSNRASKVSESQAVKPELQSAFKFPASQTHGSLAPSVSLYESSRSALADSPTSPPVVSQRRKTSETLDADRVRQAEQRIRLANEAHKEKPVFQPTSGFGSIMRRRKSSKNLKAVSISTPTLVASTNKDYEPVQQPPPVPPIPLVSSQSSSPVGGSGLRHSKNRSGDSAGNGLQRFLSRLRKKSEHSNHSPTHSESISQITSPLRSPTLVPPTPSVAPLIQSSIQAEKKEPPLSTFAKSVDDPDDPPPVTPPKNTTAHSATPSRSSGRAPVSYDVAKTRKRAGSVSQQSSSTEAANSTIGLDSTWTPVDPETSMASWRSSTITTDERPISSAESVRKLREAADALGLDPSKVDQLVADATPPIPEESEEAPDHRPKSSVVRRTIVVGSASRLSQMLLEATETQSARPSSPEALRPIPPGLRRSNTYTQIPTTSSRPRDTRHRKISSESTRWPSRPMMPHSNSTGHMKQTSVDSSIHRSPKKAFKPLTLASSLPPSTSNNSLLSVASGSTHSHRRSTKSLRRLTSQEDDEVLASGELPASGKATSRRLSTRADVQPGDRLEINEMDDGSFFWQVVRSKLRSDRPGSEISSFTGFHSRSSSAESIILPEPTSPSTRIARPSILDPKRDASGSNDMRLVWAPQHTHRRMRSTEGVGKLPYIHRHEDEAPPSGFRNSHYSVSSDVEVFEADDEMVSHLIHDLTSSMDNGAFNFIRAEALQNHPSHVSIGSTPGLRLRSPPTSP